MPFNLNRYAEIGGDPLANYGEDPFTPDPGVVSPPPAASQGATNAPDAWNTADPYVAWTLGNDAYLNEYNRVRALGDTRTLSAWTKEALANAPQDLAAFNSTMFGGLPGNLGGLLDQANNAGAVFDQPDPAPSFFDSPPQEQLLPPALQNVLDRLFPPASDTPASVTPTPEELAPSVVISPTAYVTNIVNNIVNFFSPGSGNAASVGTDNPVGLAGSTPVQVGDNSTVLSFIKNLFPAPAQAELLVPTNGAPLYNSGQQGSVVTPSQFSQGQTLDPAQATPQGSPSPIAGFIRGLNLPGLSAIKSDKALIVATLAAPLLVLLGLWLLGKIIKRG